MREVWQQRCYDRRVRDDNEFAEIAEYIRQNPVRRGLVEQRRIIRIRRRAKPW